MRDSLVSSRCNQSRHLSKTTIRLGYPIAKTISNVFDRVYAVRYALCQVSTPVSEWPTARLPIRSQAGFSSSANCIFRCFRGNFSPLSRQLNRSPRLSPRPSPRSFPRPSPRRAVLIKRVIGVVRHGRSVAVLRVTQTIRDNYVKAGIFSGAGSRGIGVGTITDRASFSFSMTAAAADRRQRNSLYLLTRFFYVTPRSSQLCKPRCQLYVTFRSASVYDRGRPARSVY